MKAITSSWPVLFIAALAYHVVKLMTFQHDGTKLPRPGGALTYLLVVLAVTVVVWLGEGDGSVVSKFVTVALTIGFLVFALNQMGKMAVFSGVLLILLGSTVLERVFGLVLGTPLNDGLMVLMIVWNVAAMVILLQRAPKKDV